MYQFSNNNPLRKRVGDCTVRAISKLLGKEWEETYIDLCVYGYRLADMPSANAVWGKYLEDNGFERGITVSSSVKDFCRIHKQGRFIIETDGHIVACIDGDWFDTWNSGTERPEYIWKEI